MVTEWIEGNSPGTGVGLFRGSIECRSDVYPFVHKNMTDPSIANNSSVSVHLKLSSLESLDREFPYSTIFSDKTLRVANGKREPC